jgi:hypothetical protein
VWRSLVARRLWVAEVPGSNPGTPISDNKFRSVCHHADMADSAAENSDLRKDEAAALRSQIATSNAGRGGRRYAPYVFTEQGVAMLSSVLRSKTAIAVNIEIMRAFVELRRVANSYAAIEKRLGQIECGMGEHDEQLEQIFGALRQLIAPPLPPKRPVGFRVREDDEESKPRSTA